MLTVRTLISSKWAVLQLGTKCCNALVNEQAAILCLKQSGIKYVVCNRGSAAMPQCSFHSLQIHAFSSVA